MTILEQLEAAVKTHDQSLLEESFREAARCGIVREHALKAMTQGLDSVRAQLKDHLVSIPEFLLGVDVLRQGFVGLEMLKTEDPLPKVTEAIIIGVVEGDVHDLGKNIVAGVLEACGYMVVDMGRDVPGRRFIEEARRVGASVLALSSMMSTPLEYMREVIAWSKRDLPDVAVLVGGAALDEKIADTFGADGYAASAATVCEETRRILARRKG
jgi:methanogenic corrinoid protein MtbC1